MQRIFGVEYTKARLKKLAKKSDYEEVIKAMLDGKPLPVDDLSAALDELCDLIASIDYTTDPDVLASGLLRSSLAGTSVPCCTVDDAGARITVAQDKVRQRIEEEEARAADDLAARIALARKRSDSTEAYTTDEIKTFADSQGCTAGEFARRWIVRFRDSVYLFVDGEYSPVKTISEFDDAAHTLLAPAMLQSPNPLLPVDLLKDHASGADVVRASLTAATSTYDPATRTFVEAVAALRKLEPAHDEEIDKWLGLLGGADAESLRDWLVSLTMLDRQACAVYLQGPKGIGKGMLAEGAAMLWSQGMYTPLDHALKQFNDSLAACPLVVADEHTKGVGSTAELRTFIGSTKRMIDRKHLPSIPLEGAIRLLLLANNDTLLSFAKESMNEDDKAAVADRFLHIVTNDAAAKYLGTLGNHATTEAWVKGCGIARHILWMAEHRGIVQPGKRFIVEGKASGIHELLAINGYFEQLICEWITRRLLEELKPQSSALPKVVIYGNGQLFVNARLLTDHWDTYVKSAEKYPNTTKVGRALTNLSRGEQKIGTLRYKEVDFNLVCRWAETRMHLDTEPLRMLIDRKVEAKQQAA